MSYELPRSGTGLATQWAAKVVGDRSRSEKDWMPARDLGFGVYRVWSRSYSEVWALSSSKPWGLSDVLRLPARMDSGYAVLVGLLPFVPGISGESALKGLAADMFHRQAAN